VRPSGVRRDRPVLTETSSLSDAEFSAAVTAVTSAFGDTTRREIYLYVRESDGVTASEVASAFDVHPNVARHHLDKLAGGGYLDVFVERPGASGAGRPSKRYRVAHKDVALDFPARRDELLVTLLGRALAILDPKDAEQMAEQVGEEYGAALAAQMSPGVSQRSLRSALHAVAEALTAHGFAAHAEERENATAVVADHCPFGEMAAEHPVVCAVDRGMVRGMLAGLYGNPIPVTMSSRAKGDDECRALV
jgi:predicted ArsR family transcriptional regulator